MVGGRPMTAGMTTRRSRRRRERQLSRLRGAGRVGVVATLIVGLSLGGVSAALAASVPSPSPSTSDSVAPADGVTPPVDDATPPADDATPPADDATPVDPAPVETDLQEPAAPSDDARASDEAGESEDGGAVDGAHAEPGDAPAPRARSLAADAVITPLASSSTMDVTVRARVLAAPTGLTGVQIGTDTSYTGGTVFQLYTYTNYAAGPQTATGYTCTIGTTSPTAGECTISIPNANVASNQGGNQGKRFWAVQENPVPGSPAAATYRSNSLLLGDYQGPTQQRWIAGLTPAVAGNVTTTLPMAASADSGSTVITANELGNSLSVKEAGSFGAVANSLFNPVLSPKCTEQQLRIALVLDQSASIDAGEWTQYRNALVDSNGVLPLLKSANALVSILGFGSNASTGGNGWHGAAAPALLPQDYASRIPTTRPGGNANATNWDDALGTIAAANAIYDYNMVLFITDGAPNYVLNGTAVDSYNVTLRSLEAPIYEANKLKHAGTRVVAVGVGSGITGAGPNLRAVSGATLNSDYFQTPNWTDLKKQLSDIVNEATCQIPIEVSKTTVSASGITTTNAGGWSFSGTKTGGDTGATLAGAATQTTTPGAGGTANWTLGFTQPSGQTATVRLAEQTQSGWTLSGVQCRRGGGDFVSQPVADGSVTLTGLTTGSGKITCVFTNTENPKTAQVTWSKTDASSAALLGGSEWTITGPGFPAPGVVVVDCTAAGCSGADKDSVAGQFRLEGLAWGAYTVTESKAPAGYVLGNPAASFTFTVDASNAGTTIAKGAQKNTRATGTVTWSKTDASSGALIGGSEWTLVGPTGAGSTTTIVVDCVAAGCSGADKDSVAGQFRLEGLAWGAYTVTESKAPAGYVLGNPAASFTFTVDASNAGTTIAKGAQKNTRATGTVTWSKTDASSGALIGGSEWTLVGPTGAGSTTTIVVDCVAAGCSGADKDSVAGQFRLEGLAWGTYTLTETKAPPGYLLDTTPHTFTVDAANAGRAIPLGAYTNQAVTPPTIPLTGGVSRDAYLIAGSLILLIGAAAFGLLRVRARRNGA